MEPLRLFFGTSVAAGFFAMIACATPQRGGFDRLPASFYAKSFAADRTCTDRIARRIIAGNPKAPQVIYRFGKTSVLRSHVVNGIGPAEWAERFRGPGSQWKLPPYRRGLYGTDKPLRADPFADLAAPALIRVTVKEECRQRARVGTTLRIHEDPRFIRYLGSDLEAFRKACVKEGAPIGRLYTPIGENPASASAAEFCEETVDRFFDSVGIQMVQDEAVESSWYLRDLSCIGKIEGSPDELIRIFAEPDLLANDECGSSSHSLSTFRVLMRALIESRNPSESALASIRSQWVNSERVRPSVSIWVPDLLGAYGRCRRQENLPALAKAIRLFDELLAAIPHYEQHLYIEGVEPDPGFAEICL